MFGQWKRTLRQPRSAEWYRSRGRIYARFRWDGVIGAIVVGRMPHAVFGTTRVLDCTCDGRAMACPHVRAVQRDWIEASSRFFDLRAEATRLGVPAEVLPSIERELLRNPRPLLEARRRRRFEQALSAYVTLVQEQAAATSTH